jgi:hypothetical protein
MTLIGVLLASCGMKGPPRLPVYEIPHVPQDIKVLQRYHPRQVILNWDYPEGKKDSVAGFAVKRSDDMGSSREEIVNETAFTDSNLEENRSYTYSVSAVGINRIHGDASESVEVAPVTDLAEPGDLTFDIGNDTVTLSWKYPDSSVSFNIYRDEALASINRDPVREVFLYVTPNPDTAVSYIIRAVKETNILTEGPPSAEIVIGPEDYIPSSPSGLGFAFTEGKVLLLWDENPEIWIRGYRAYRSLTEDGEFLPIGISETPAFADTDNLSGKRFYRVRTIGPLKEGPFSESIAVELKH